MFGVTRLTTANVDISGKALGLFEVIGYTPTLIALDAIDKAGDVTLLQLELNDLLGTCIKVVGSVSSVHAAIAAGKDAVAGMGVESVSSVINAPIEDAMPALVAGEEYSPIIEADIVLFPTFDRAKTSTDKQGSVVVSDSGLAIGMIETQGFTAVLEAIDTACKAADVEVLGKEKLGGGYVTVVIRGDVAAVQAAVAAGTEKVEGLGTLIASHVIPRPSEAVRSLLP